MSNEKKDIEMLYAKIRKLEKKIKDLESQSTVKPGYPTYEKQADGTYLFTYHFNAPFNVPFLAVPKV